MDLLTALKILVRQWPVVLLGLALTIGGVKQVGGLVKPTYQAKATALLLGPGTGNRLLAFDGNLEVTADALIVVMHSDTGVELVDAAGADGTYELVRPNGPLIEITSSAPTGEDATATVDHVLTVLEQQLQIAQEGAADTERITLDVLSPPVAAPEYGSRIRAQAAAGAMGLTLTVTAGLLTDALRRNRRERRDAAAGDEAHVPGHDEPGVDEPDRDHPDRDQPDRNEPGRIEPAGVEPGGNGERVRTEPVGNGERDRDAPAHRTSAPEAPDQRGDRDDRWIEPAAAPAPSEATRAEPVFVGAAAATGQDPWTLRAAAAAAARSGPPRATLPEAPSDSRWSTPSAPRAAGAPVPAPMVERPTTGRSASRGARANGRAYGREPGERPDSR